MTTYFGSIGAEFHAWARDRYPSGLVSSGVKSGVKAIAASTMRGSA